MGRGELRIQTAILLVLMPALVVAALIFGYLVYSELYDGILQGFDYRLRSVSTVTAAFIDPDEHDSLLQPIEMTAGAYDPARGTLYGADSRGFLYVVDPESGSASLVSRTSLGEVGGMAFDPERGDLWVVHGPDSRLIKLDPVTGAHETTSLSLSGCRSLAWDRVGNRLFCAGGALGTVTVAGGRITDVTTRPSPCGPVGAVEMLPNGTLIALTADRDGLLRPTADGSGCEEVLLLRPASEGEETLQPMVDLVYRTGAEELLGLSDRLVRIDLETGAVENYGYWGYRSEEDPLYRAYVEPMRRIKEKADLSYLYSFVLRDGYRKIVYVLDASRNEDHSYIGDVDADTAEEGTVRVFREGGVHLSEIEYWEQWGLIKSADAAIYDDEGEVRGVAGSDVNISVIEEKTRQVLFQVILMAGFCLAFAMVAAVRVSRTLVRPIEQLKQETLKVAAGQFGERIAVERPAELRDLSHSFNDMSGALQQTLDGLSRSNRELELERCKAELLLALAGRADEPRPPVESPIRVSRIRAGSSSRDSSGWSWNKDRLYFWIVDTSPEDPFEAVRLRSDLAVTVRALVDKAIPEESWAEGLLSLFEDEVAAVGRFDPAARTVEGLARRSVTLVVEEAGQARVILEKAEGEFRLTANGSGGVLVVGGEMAALLEESVRPGSLGSAVRLLEESGWVPSDAAVIMMRFDS